MVFQKDLMRTALISLAVLTALVPASAQASFPGRPGLIAYTQEAADGTTAIFVARGRSGEPKRLTSATGCARDAAFSPRGRLIAYAFSPNCADFDLWVMHADGSGKHRLTRLDGDEIKPAFSARGRFIAFSHRPPGREPIDALRVPVSGGRSTLLVPGAYDPVYSANGRWLAWVAFDGLYVGRADGSSPRRVAEGGLEPEFTPNNRRIVYRRSEGFLPCEARPEALLVISPTGTGRRVVKKSCNLQQPAVSPAGGWLVAIGSDLYRDRGAREYHLTMRRMPQTHAPLPLGGAPIVRPRSNVEPEPSWQALPRGG